MEVWKAKVDGRKTLSELDKKGVGTLDVRKENGNRNEYFKRNKSETFHSFLNL